ncbi:hypothetical protein OEA41_003724 [Lepraria neglecta]|uniref:Uncharacterized protein n=1 Tax=Lepraria neglecta TaxID=209136 RepID=A0AAE0DJI6_9LECA|nr:hypothetical protein OEA41_003724 [Lepraria neglecta]
MVPSPSRDTLIHTFIIWIHRPKKIHQYLTYVMQYSSILNAAAAFFVVGTVVAQNSAQVNLYDLIPLSPLDSFDHGNAADILCSSYYDKECQHYAGHEYPASGQVTGGPYGS